VFVVSSELCPEDPSGMAAGANRFAMTGQGQKSACGRIPENDDFIISYN
jgi:hypothetical protein